VSKGSLHKYATTLAHFVDFATCADLIKRRVNATMKKNSKQLVEQLGKKAR